MDATIRSIIEDFHSTVLPSVLPRLVRRDLSLGRPLEPAVGNLAKVVVGMRRSGKTFRLFQEIGDLLASGVPEERVLYFNFDDDRVRPLREDSISRVLETFYEMCPAARREGAWLFLDEVQDVPGWDVAARRVVDTEKATLYLTGSSSKMLSTDVATQFRGRSVAYELLPYGFGEFLAARGKAFLASERGKEAATELRSLLPAYLSEGGFPGAQGLDAPERVSLLQSYVQLTVSRDVVERGRYPNAAFVRGLARTAVASTARDFSVSKVHARAKADGYSPGRAAITSMLEALEDAHLLYEVYEFSRSVQKTRLGGLKLYAADPALAGAVAPATTDGVPRALETAVYLELRRRRNTTRAGEVSMLKLPSGREVDFCTGDEAVGAAYSLVQSCWSLERERTLEREMAALREAMDAMGVPEGTVVTEREERDIAVPEGTVRVVPAWKWLLGRD